MKILIVHNNYGKYSGEEVVVDKMNLMFQSLGHTVAQLRMSTAETRDTMAGKIKGFVCGFYCPSGIRALRDAIQREKPDVVNVHNLYPFISPSALRECQKSGVKVVMTVHNFRLICPTGLFMRDGRPCELCLEKGNEWSCVTHNCEHSLLKSIGYAGRNALARMQRHYMECVDAFACITDFQRTKLLEAGFQGEKLHLIPNSIECSTSNITIIGDYVAFCGRLSTEKGVDMIIEVARRNPHIPFKFAGLWRDDVLATDLPQNIDFKGYLYGNELDEFYKKARFFVMASRCYEGFPMSILEAANFGKTTIGPNHGGFTEIIGTGSDRIGLLFDPLNCVDLESKIQSLWNSPDLSTKLGNAAKSKLQQQFSTQNVAIKWQNLLVELFSK